MTHTIRTAKEFDEKAKKINTCYGRLTRLYNHVSKDVSGDEMDKIDELYSSHHCRIKENRKSR